MKDTITHEDESQPKSANNMNMGKGDRESLRAIRAVLENMEGRVDGMLRITELFEARRPSGRAIVTPWAGWVVGIESAGIRRVIIQTEENVEDSIVGQELGEDIAVGEATSRRNTGLPHYWPAGTALTARHLTRLREAKIESVHLLRGVFVPRRGTLLVRVGDFVEAGHRLTPGPLDPHEILANQGPSAVMEYMVREIQTVYKMHGIDIHDKHIEVIVRQMLRKRQVTASGETGFLPGQIVDRFEFDDANRVGHERVTL